METSATLSVADDGVTVEAVGEFDVSTAQTLTAALADAASYGVDVTLDLRRATFVDLVAFRVILAARTHQRSRRHEFTVIGAPRSLLRLAEVLDETDLLAS